MSPQTIAYLNDINRAFYATIAHDFDQTRQQSWQGWLPLLAHLPPTSQPVRVLDIGCGNGRFALFLAQHGYTVRYHGLDSNATLLQFAHQSLHAHPQIEAQLTETDVILHAPTHGEYDVVVAFGLLHHVPSADYRLRWMQAVAQRVAVGGMLAFACWCFYEDDSLRARLVPWDDSAPTDLDPHDYLLDWRRGARAVRYCHYVDEAEHDRLVQATHLREVMRYRADGASATLNRYSVLQRDS